MQEAYVKCQVSAVAEMYSLKTAANNEVLIIRSDNSAMSIVSGAVSLCQGINTLICNACTFDQSNSPQFGERG